MGAVRLPYRDSSIAQFIVEQWKLLVALVVGIGAIFTRRVTHEIKVKNIEEEVGSLREQIKDLETRFSTAQNIQRREDVLNEIDREATKQMDEELKYLRRKLDNIDSNIAEIHGQVMGRGR